MAETVTEANAFIEVELHRLLENIGDAFDAADVLTYSGTITFGMDNVVREAVEGLRKAATPQPNLVVLLTTPGGIVEVVQRMVDCIRYHYKTGVVTFVIPDYAYSAGTVFAMSGDHIVMDYFGRLGPPQ